MCSRHYDLCNSPGNKPQRLYKISFNLRPAWKMPQCAGAAISKYHRLGGLNSRRLLSHGPGGEKCKSQVLAWPVSSEASFLAGKWLWSLFSRGLPCTWASVFGSVWVPIFSSYKETSYTGVGPTVMTSFNLITPL